MQYSPFRSIISLYEPQLRHIVSQSLVYKQTDVKIRTCSATNCCLPTPNAVTTRFLCIRGTARCRGKSFSELTKIDYNLTVNVNMTGPFSLRFGNSPCCDQWNAAFYINDGKFLSLYRRLSFGCWIHQTNILEFPFTAVSERKASILAARQFWNKKTGFDETKKNFLLFQHRMSHYTTGARWPVNQNNVSFWQLRIKIII